MLEESKIIDLPEGVTRKLGTTSRKKNKLKEVKRRREEEGRRGKGRERKKKFTIITNERPSDLIFKTRIDSRNSIAGARPRACVPESLQIRRETVSWEREGRGIRCDRRT